jgi:hypothetical protein
MIEGILIARVTEGTSLFSAPVWKHSFVHLDGNFLHILKRELKPKELSKSASIENFWSDIFLQARNLFIFIY